MRVTKLLFRWWIKAIPVIAVNLFSALIDSRKVQWNIVSRRSAGHANNYGCERRKPVVSAIKGDMAKYAV